MYKLAIIGGGRMACIYAQAARELGVETFAFSLKNGYVDPSVFDHTYYINILERDRILSICQQVGIQGVVATTELTIAIAAFIASKMKLNGIPFSSAEAITNKYRNRNVTANVKGLFQPKYIEASSTNDILSYPFTYPIIIKPATKGGKRGISVVKCKEDVAAAYQYALHEANGDLPIVVEEFIEGGQEYSVESLSYKDKSYIIQVTHKTTSGPPHCVELGHHQPANLSPKMREKVEQVLTDVLSAIGVEFGPCHSEIKIKNDRIYLIECNARPGGDHIAYPLTELSTGYSYIKGAIEIALDIFKGVDPKSFQQKYAGVMFITEQTKHLKPLFDTCESYVWCIKKNCISDDLSPLIHNDGYNTNYIMYCSNVVPDEIKEQLNILP